MKLGCLGWVKTRANDASWSPSLFGTCRHVASVRDVRPEPPPNCKLDPIASIVPAGEYIHTQEVNGLGYLLGSTNTEKGLPRSLSAVVHGWFVARVAAPQKGAQGLNRSSDILNVSLGEPQNDGFPIRSLYFVGSKGPAKTLTHVFLHVTQARADYMRSTPTRSSMQPGWNKARVDKGGLGFCLEENQR